MYEKNGILTKKEQLVNLIYFIFRYTLYLSGFITLYKYNEGFAVIFAIIFVWLSHSFYWSTKKIIYDYEYRMLNLMENIQKSKDNNKRSK